MSIQRIFSALLLTIALTLSNFATALAAPPTPSSFWGIVTLDGASVPAGTIISARINGVQYASVAVTINLGTAYYSISVPAMTLPLQASLKGYHWGYGGFLYRQLYG